MFDVVLDLLNQFLDCLPFLIVLYLVFDFLGSFFFGKR